MSYRFLADDAFALKSSKGACAFEQDTLACGPEVKTPSEFSVRIPALTLYTRCSYYTGQGREALL
jgi:ribonuclease T2